MKEVGWDIMDCNHLAQDKELVTGCLEEYLDYMSAINFLSRAVLHGTS
jgi:hypothetical protein